MGLYKNQIFKYAKNTYGTLPEYLWQKDPQSAVLRHGDNLKWYALIMNIPKTRLGLDSGETADILDVKCDNIIIGSLLRNSGYFPAYHMNKQNWITVLLDGTVPFEEIRGLIDLSYELTKKKTK